MARPALVDIHNHLIPGVDDGARSLEQALEAIGQMWEQGVRRITTTPHIDAEIIARPERFAARIAELDAAWAQLARSARERFPGLELARGNEIMLDTPHFAPSDARVRLAGSHYVLVEFPRLFIPAGTADLLYRLRAAGWTPVVAHPERYQGGSEGTLALVDSWRRVGARMIVNAGSLMGGFGKEARQFVLQLLRLGWVDMIGSDYHARPQRPLLLAACYDQLCTWGGGAQATLLLSTNPGLVMDGAELHEVPPLDVAEGPWARIRRLLNR